MNNLKSIKARVLEDTRARAAYEMQKPEFDIAREHISAYACAGMTQTKLTDRTKMTQPTLPD